jgi:glycosyltransferase involved in cell wall biosynthesis
MAEILVAICTYNPDEKKFGEVLKSIKQQTFKKYRLIVIDNASSNFPTYLLDDIKHELYVELNRGSSFARFNALSKWHGEKLFIFVDDDNILDIDYFQKAIKNCRDYPNWGGFGGQQYPDQNLRMNKITLEVLPYLGIRSLGEMKLQQSASLNWNKLEPIGAGMCLSNIVVEYFLNLPDERLDKYFSLGRNGKKLLSGEDSFIVRQAANLGMQFGYDPHLRLKHSIKPERVKILYLCRLLFSYGKSDVILNDALGIEPDHPYPSTLLQTFLEYLWQLMKGKAGFIIGLRQIGIYCEIRKMKNSRE